MKARVEAGTDISMVGAWDAGQDSAPLAKTWGKEYNTLLEDEARAGRLFLIHTGGDGGGPIDVFLDEEIPEALQKHVTRKPAEFLLRIPSGRLVVGGIEDYRSAKPQITGPDSIVNVLPGDYLLTCFVGDEENIPHTPTKAELEKAVGPEDFQYSKRIDRQGCFGFLAFLLFPILWPVTGWLWAAIITVVLVLAFFNIRERVFLQRNARYQRIDKAINEVWLAAKAKDAPTFIFQLRKVDYAPELKGGSLRLN